MAVIYEEFIRCEKCSCPDFKKEEVYTFHKKVRPRSDKTAQLEHLDLEFRYVCRECNHELNR